MASSQTSTLRPSTSTSTTKMSTTSPSSQDHQLPEPSKSPSLTAAAWADTPYALIPTPLPSQSAYTSPTIPAASLIAHEMSHLHCMLLRGLNSLYQQAPHVQTESSIASFLQYGNHWCTTLNHHHATEETFLFPRIDALAGEALMTPNLAQHLTFEAGIEALDHYCLTTDPSAYSSQDFRGIIESFGSTLRAHLNDEIGTLVALDGKVDGDKLKALWRASSLHARSKTDKNIGLPMIIGTYDVTYQGGALSEFNLPIVLLWANEWVYSRKWADCWRFLPCDTRGRPRALVGAEEGTGMKERWKM
ncbi:hypothetical protein BT63DRAFT_437367 [Microthyrium microscopicum]|uniref:Hemerythrin-like domain-containing protein n=1 Tax=Microthyrium microscopicum TaxID=703497 RepID=A0A6A6UQN1_9PEZI|nr:hypothetical protein BT63DRAFT_437367 [Microthyrium microscopicum]